MFAVTINSSEEYKLDKAFHSPNLPFDFVVDKAPQSTEVFYLDDGEQKIGPIEKVYVTTLVTPMGLASSFNGGILKIIAKK